MTANLGVPGAPPLKPPIPPVRVKPLGLRFLSSPFPSVFGDYLPLLNSLIPMPHLNPAMHVCHTYFLQVIWFSDGAGAGG